MRGKSAFARLATVRRSTLVGVLVLAFGVSAWAVMDNIRLVGDLHDARAEHVNQNELTNLVRAGRTESAFLEAFEKGDTLFATAFNSLDGVGSEIGEGLRFTRIPRADLSAWMTQRPSRATGPNGQSCTECHNVPTEDGAGSIAGNNIRDPLNTGNIRMFITRQPPHLFGLGAVQRLAEEMSQDLFEIRNRSIAAARFRGTPVTARLVTKGIDFGTITVSPAGAVDASAAEGVDADLIIKPFDWKGVFPTIRAFNRGAGHQELGMQAVELTGNGVDGDYDGVVDELTVGDITALAIYNAAQPRPTTKVELAGLGLIPRLSSAEIGAIQRGTTVFSQMGCASCHDPDLRIDRPIFSEPSQNPAFRETAFPAGQNPASLGLNDRFPITFDLTRDQTMNRVPAPGRAGLFRLGAFERDGSGRAVVRLYGDLKRHNMGPELAEYIDADGVPAAVYLTEALWGVGSTAPYLHDGRASTLTEAILFHGGEAASSRNRFHNAALEQQRDLIAFLSNLVLFKTEEE